MYVYVYVCMQYISGFANEPCTTVSGPVTRPLFSKHGQELKHNFKFYVSGCASLRFTKLRNSMDQLYQNISEKIPNMYATMQIYEFYLLISKTDFLTLTCEIFMQMINFYMTIFL